MASKTNIKTKILTPWSKYLINDHNDGPLQYTKDPLPLAASYMHPGLCFTHYDRDDVPSIPLLMRLLTEVRNVVFFTYVDRNGELFIDFPRIYQGRLLFVTSSEIEMQREFSDIAIPKWPLKVTVYLQYVGKTSFTIGLSLSLPTSDIPLVNQKSTYVLVDENTRRPTILPDWFREKYGNRAASTIPCRVGTLNKPNETFHYELRVLRSHTDANDHTNYSTYAGFALDSLRAALKLKTQQKQQQHQNQNNAGQHTSASSRYPIQGLRGISDEIVKNGLKKIELCYTHESEEGDLLDVHLWQEEGDDFLVKAILEKQGEVICHMRLEYFDVASHL